MIKWEPTTFRLTADVIVPVGEIYKGENGAVWRSERGNRFRKGQRK